MAGNLNPSESYEDRKKRWESMIETVVSEMCSEQSKDGTLVRLPVMEIVRNFKNCIGILDYAKGLNDNIEVCHTIDVPEYLKKEV